VLALLLRFDRISLGGVALLLCLEVIYLLAYSRRRSSLFASGFAVFLPELITVGTSTLLLLEFIFPLLVDVVEVLVPLTLMLLVSSLPLLDLDRALLTGRIRLLTILFPFLLN
jgi:hypothetical protein